MTAKERSGYGAWVMHLQVCDLPEICAVTNDTGKPSNYALILLQYLIELAFPYPPNQTLRL